jgi:hypothetical protein
MSSSRHVRDLALACCVLSAITSCSGSDDSDAEGRVDAAALSAHDRSQIIATAAEHRVEVANGSGRDNLYDSVDVVENLGTPGPRGIDWGDRTPMTRGDREAIASALAPRTVNFVPEVEYPEIQVSDTYAILTLSAPTTVDERLTIMTGLWCGFSCGIGGAHIVGRDADGTWTIGEPVAPQWIA